MRVALARFLPVLHRTVRLLGALLLLLCLLPEIGQAQTVAPRSSRPNVVVILVDDLGAMDVDA